MQIIVIGSGKVGSSLARMLVNKGHGVVIIENNRALLENAKDIDCVKIHGVPIDQDVLKNAGIEEVDAVCTVTQDDNMNIMTAQVAKEIFKVKKVVARIFNPQSKYLFEEFGLDTICSTSITANALFRALESETDDQEHMIFGEDLVYTQVCPEGRYFGMEISEYSRMTERHITAIIREDKMIITLPGMRIEKGDVLVLVSISDNME